MKRNIIIMALALLTASSCLKDVDNSAAITIHLAMPQDLEAEIDLSTIPINLRNKNNPFSYSGYPDKEGNISFRVQPGKYDILASVYFEYSRIAINGSVSEFLLTDEGIVSDSGEIVPSQIYVNLDVAIPNPLIIRELYYHGSSTLEGANYTKDQYIELYNNAGPGGKTIYLDSLCLATIYPANSTVASNAWSEMDTIAIFQMFWVFPGDGSTYPLAPGESCVIAAKAAVNHSSRATSGLHLEKSHFGCYDDNLSGHEIAAGIPRMICYMAGQGTAWGFSIHSPAFVVFKPEMGVKAYRDNSALWERYAPGTSAGTKYWHIAKSWIQDAVECADSPDKSVKRLPSSIDASYVWMRSAHYSGKCITRKLQGTYEGVEVYQDTNNSDADFIPDSELNPRLKN